MTRGGPDAFPENAWPPRWARSEDRPPWRGHEMSRSRANASWCRATRTLFRTRLISPAVRLLRPRERGWRATGGELLGRRIMANSIRPLAVRYHEQSAPPFPGHVAAAGRPEGRSDPLARVPVEAARLAVERHAVDVVADQQTRANRGDGRPNGPSPLSRRRSRPFGPYHHVRGESHSQGCALGCQVRPFQGRQRDSRWNKTRVFRPQQHL